MNNNKIEKKSKKNTIADKLKLDEEVKNNIDIKDNKQQNIKTGIHYSKLSIILAFIILIVVFLVKISDFRTKKDNQNYKENKIIADNNKIINNKSKYNDVVEIKNLQDNIYDLEQKLSYDNEYIKTLENKIEELEVIIENQNNKLNMKIIDAIKVAIAIQNNIKYDKDYSNLLLDLEKLDETNIMKDNINILKKYENKAPSSKTILILFNNESKKFLKEHNILKKSKNLFAKFLSNFVVIRKINNFEEETADQFVSNIGDLLEQNNYSDTMKILENNTKYSKYFDKTFNALKNYISLNNAINEIINNLINKETRHD